MKNNLFIVASINKQAKVQAAKVAEFFSMRLFDAVEMFEFDHAPRKLDEVCKEFGEDYVKKEMKKIAKMQLDFDEAVFACDIRYLDAIESIYSKIKEKNLVIFLNDNKAETNKLLRLGFLCDCCDIAIDVTNISAEDVFARLIDEIKGFYGIEV